MHRRPISANGLKIENTVVCGEGLTGIKSCRDFLVFDHSPVPEQGRLSLIGRRPKQRKRRFVIATRKESLREAGYSAGIDRSMATGQAEISLAWAYTFSMANE